MKTLFITFLILNYGFYSCQNRQPINNKEIKTIDVQKSKKSINTLDTIIRPFIIICNNPQEVRMGAPYNSCNLELVGQHKINLPKASWQDKYAWSNDSRKLVLIKWDFENNEPGFHLFYINIEANKTLESKRIFGLPNSISIVDKKVTINKFLFDKAKPTDGKLCCHVIEEIEFPL